MQRRRGSGIYEFRKRLPTSLAGQLCPENLRSTLAELVNPLTGCFKRELTTSLKTTDHHLAKRRDLREASRVTDLLDLAQRMVSGRASDANAQGGLLSSSSFPSPEEIETAVIADILAADERERDEGDDRFHLHSPEERAHWPDLEAIDLDQPGMTDTHLELLGGMAEEHSRDYRRAMAKRQFAIVKPELHAYLKAHDLPIDPTSPFYKTAGLAVLSGHVKAYDLIGQRQAGDVVPTPEVKPEGPQAGPKLSEALAHWKQGSQARGGKQPSRNTVTEAERAVRYFTQWHGDVRIGEIDKPKARDFRNALAMMPTRLTAKQRALPLRQLIDALSKKGRGTGGGGTQSEQAPAHAATVNKSLNLLAAIVSAAERDGRLDSVAGFANPFRNLTIVIDQRYDTQQRQPFTDAQLAALFATKVFTEGHRPLGGGGEAVFWFPLVALLTGARLNEIAQLRIADIRQEVESGVWFIDIGTEGGRSIKTASSRRQVPLHGELIRLGLLRYREARLAAKGVTATDSLWPDVRSADGVYAATAYTKFFGRFLRKTAGITDKAIVFHSFRHSFKRLCRDAGLSEELHDALTGHSSGASVGRGYGAGFGLKALSDGVSRIVAPPSLKNVSPWQSSGNASRPVARRR